MKIGLPIASDLFSLFIPQASTISFFLCHILNTAFQKFHVSSMMDTMEMPGIFHFN